MKRLTTQCLWKSLCIVLVYSHFPFISSCTNENKQKNREVVDQKPLDVVGNKVSLINLIAKPQEYHKKKVEVKGFLHVEFENCAIYLSQEDYAKGIDKNSIWIQISKNEIKNMDNLSDNYVIVEGLFDKDNHGHENNYSGAIGKITKLKAIK